MMNVDDECSFVKNHATILEKVLIPILGIKEINVW